MNTFTRFRSASVFTAFSLFVQIIPSLVLADNTKSAILQAHTKPVTALGFTNDSKKLISASEDGALRVWDLENKESSVLAQQPIALRSLAIFRDATLFTGNDAGQLEIRDLTSPRSTARAILAHANWTTVTSPRGNVLSDVLSRFPVVAVAGSPDGTKVATGASDGTIALWNSDSGRELNRMTGHAAGITGLSFSPDGSLLASGSSDRTIRLWDPNTGRELSILRRRRSVEWDAGVSAVVVEASGKRIFSTGRMAEVFGDYSIRAWEISDGQETAAFELPDSAGSCIAISRDGSHCAVGTWNGAVYLLSPKPEGILEKERVWKLHESAAVTCIAISKDGRIIAAGGIGNDVVLIRW